jgi:hypothetical protein
MLAMDALSFDPIAHRYSHGARELISVTQALKEAGVIETRWYTDEAAQRGTAVHHAIAAHWNQDRSATWDGEVEPYFQAYLRFVRETGVLFEQVERQVCDLTLGYAGTFDALGMLHEQRVLCDFKTGTTPAWAGIQLAGYRRLLLNPHSLHRYSVELRDDGTYRLTEWTERSDERVFLAALAIAQWKRLHR